jgi:hypothetical protein
MPRPRLYTIPSLTAALRTEVLKIEKEAGAPLGFNQDLLIEDLCIALGVDVALVLGYQPSNAITLGWNYEDALFLLEEPTRQRLEATCPS